MRRIFGMCVIAVLALFSQGCGGEPEDEGETKAKGKDVISSKILKAKKTQCRHNLSQLWKMQYNYMVQFGGSHKMMPAETGGAFWLKLSDPETLLIDPRLFEIYACPVKGKGVEGKTDYRGPVSNVNRYKDGDPVGACLGNHGDGTGNVVRKSGDTHEMKEGEEIFKRAMEKTKP